MGLATMINNTRYKEDIFNFLRDHSAPSPRRTMAHRLHSLPTARAVLHRIRIDDLRPPERHDNRVSAHAARFRRGPATDCQLPPAESRHLHSAHGRHSLARALDHRHSRRTAVHSALSPLPPQPHSHRPAQPAVGHLARIRGSGPHGRQSPVASLHRSYMGLLLHTTLRLLLRIPADGRCGRRVRSYSRARMLRALKPLHGRPIQRRHRPLPVGTDVRPEHVCLRSARTDPRIRPVVRQHRHGMPDTAADTARHHNIRADIHRPAS